MAGQASGWLSAVESNVHVMRTLLCLPLLLSAAGGLLIADEKARVIEHVAVYKEAGRFGGWPANHGIWSWGDEIVVGFELGYFKDNPKGHDIDYSRPAEHVLARSLDGGKTWTLERPEDLRPGVTTPRWTRKSL